MSDLKLVTRRTIVVAAAASLLPIKARPAIAQPAEKPSPRPIAIALPDFGGDTPADVEIGRSVVQLVSADLTGTGLFERLDPNSYPEKIRNGLLPRFADWQAINAAYVVTGRVTRPPINRLAILFYLWAVASGEEFLGQQYIAEPSAWPRIAHASADQILERLTGQTGHFEDRARQDNLKK